MKAKKLAEGAGEGVGSAPQRAECARFTPEARCPVARSVSCWAGWTGGAEAARQGVFGSGQVGPGQWRCWWTAGATSGGYLGGESPDSQGGAEAGREGAPACQLENLRSGFEKEIGRAHV